MYVLIPRSLFEYQEDLSEYQEASLNIKEPFLSGSQNELHDMGTDFLNVQCLNCLQMRLRCESIIPEEINGPNQML